MKLKKLILPLLALSLSFTSCEDAYRIDPADEIVDENAITNIDDLGLAVTGVYANIGGGSFIQWSSYFTDECRKPSTNRGQGVQVHTWSINDGTNEPESYYRGLYSTINSVNVVLSKIDDVTVNSAAETDLREKYRAELLTIRAMAHFDLMRFFTTDYLDSNALAITIVDQVIVSEQLPRNTVGEVTTFIKNDLMTAIPVLESLGDSDVTRITDLAAKAVLARLCLYTGDYDSAITYSQDLINAVPLAASPTDYLDIWADASDSEIIFKLKRVEGDGQIGRTYVDSNGDVFFNVSDDLFNQFNNSDLRYYSLLDPNSTLSNLLVGKYLGPASDYGRADIKLFRVAEMYLINAEAHLRKITPNIPAAEASINLLRANRDLGGVPALSFSSVNDGLDKVLQERRMELAFEGHRFFDLKRFNRGIDRLPSDVLLNDFAEDLPANSHLFTLPIPSAAIFANSTLQQNPMY